MENNRELVQMENRIIDRMGDGFEGVHARITRFEEEVRPQMLQQAADIAVLKFRAAQAEDAANTATKHVASSRKSTSLRASTIGGAVAGAVVVILKIVELLK